MAKGLFLAELLRAGGGSLVGCRAERTTKHPFPQSVTYSVFWSIQCEQGPEPHLGPPIPGADWKPGVIDRLKKILQVRASASSAPPLPLKSLWKPLQGRMHRQGFLCFRRKTNSFSVCGYTKHLSHQRV